MKSIAFAALLLFASIPARADYVDGFQLNQMLGALQRLERGVGSGGDDIQATNGVGYVIGVVDALSNITICVPHNVRTGQLAAMVGKYLNENPASWSKPANVAVAQLIGSTYPCKTWGAD